MLPVLYVLIAVCLIVAAPRHIALLFMRTLLAITVLSTLFVYGTALALSVAGDWVVHGIDRHDTTVIDYYAKIERFIKEWRKS